MRVWRVHLDGVGWLLTALILAVVEHKVIIVVVHACLGLLS